MGTSGPPTGFDIQNFLIPPPQPSGPGFTHSGSFPHSFHASSHPFPPSHLSPNTYTSSASALSSMLPPYAFPSQNTMYHPNYMDYPQDHGQRASPYPFPPYSQPSSAQLSPSPHSALPHSSVSQMNQRPPISNPTMDETRLMTLLSTHSSGDLPKKDESVASLLTPSTSFELPHGASDSFQGSIHVSRPSAISPVPQTIASVSLAFPSASRGLLNSKLPTGRHLVGEQIVYDIDVRLPGEAQPQLEVSPITVYGSDPLLVVGRQIAVNRNYICYGLRAGTIRILNINTALRALLRGHSQRVTDMAFFAEDVHLLASASSDGRVFVRRIKEGLGEEGKMQITEDILLSLEIVGDWDSVHPRVSWHSVLQDLLVVSIGKYVLTINIPRVAMATAPARFTVEDPVQCHLKSPIDGINCVGGHEADVTDISTSEQAYLASASEDGTVRIWDKRMIPVSLFKPHDGQPVGSVAFLSAPHHSDHIVLLTAGHLNRELKLWVPAACDGWFPQSGNVKWQCIQTLELKSSTTEKVEDAFFNQVLVVPRACIMLLANAKKNAIYVVHLEFGPNPSATRMDYLAEFFVTMPILSLTATSENVSNGVGVVQIYCVQTQAIQQYSLELVQCNPPSVEEPAFASKANLEGDLISSSNKVIERSISGTLTALDSSRVGGRIRSPEIGTRVKSPGIVSGVNMSTFLSNTFDLSGSQEQTTAATKEQTLIPAMVPGNKEVKENLAGDNLSSLPNIVVPTPKEVGLVPLTQIGSPPLGRGSGSPTLIASTELQDKLLQVHGQSSDRSTEDLAKFDAVPLSPRSISPRSIYVESLKNDEGRESPIPSVSSSVISDKQIDSGPVHLITPSELMSMAARSKVEKDGGSSSSPCAGSMLSSESNRGEIKSEENLAETDSIKIERRDIAESNLLSCEDEIADKEAVPDVSGIASETNGMNRVGAVPGAELMSENNSLQGSLTSQADSEEIERFEEIEATREKDHSVNVQVDVVQEQLKEVTAKVSDSSSTLVAPQSSALMKGKKNKNKANIASSGVESAAVSPSSKVPPALATHLTASEGDVSGSDIGICSSSGTNAQILAVQDSLNQLVAMQKEFQKQMAVMVAVPVTKEGKRMEAALGQRMEKVLKAHVDALWARIQEENAKREKSERERAQQLTTMLATSLTKDLPGVIEKALKKEVSSIGPAIARMVIPVIEKAISAAVNEAFQKGIGDKGVAQLEKSVGAKLEGVVSRQLQSQFQTTGRQAIQDTLQSCFESSVIPAFDRSCKAIFEQVDTAFQRGMVEHTTFAQQQFAASHSALASTLQETVASASSLAASLKEVADEQSKQLAESVVRSRFISSKQSNGGLPDKVVTVQTVELSLDPTIELSRLVGERRYEEAFNRALSLGDVAVVSWLCTQVDPSAIFTTSPVPLSQGVLLSLVQQLGCDLNNDTARKLTWIRDATVALNPNDPLLAPSMRRILEQLYQSLNRRLLLPSTSADLGNSIRLVMHVTNSLRASCM